jgi:hypothetical protein
MKKFFVLYVFPFLIRFVIRISYFFSRKFFYLEKEFVELCKKGPVAVALWHGDLIPIIGYFTKNIVKKRKTVVLVSPSNDGIMLGKVIKGLGGYYETGDNRKNSVYALIRMIQAVKKDACLPVFAVDGPLGPRFVVKPGVIECAKKNNIPVIGITAVSKKSFIIKSSWDKLFIPKPFTRLAIRFTGEIFTSENTEEDRKELEDILLKEKELCNRML